MVIKNYCIIHAFLEVTEKNVNCLLPKFKCLTNTCLMLNKHVSCAEIAVRISRKQTLQLVKDILADFLKALATRVEKIIVSGSMHTTGE